MRKGSLIKLIPDYEERYIILHKHTFPGVLDRIRKSNLCNYSIFLKDGILFSYYEYAGNDYEGDMTKIRQDPVTQEWWKLTDPMQQPLDNRLDGEWWSSMEEIFHRETGNESAEGSQREAYAARVRKDFQNKIIETVVEISADLSEKLRMELIRKCSIFHKDDNLYSYFEWVVKKAGRDRERGLRQMKVNKGLSWTPMQEVFHTD